MKTYIEITCPDHDILKAYCYSAILYMFRVLPYRNAFKISQKNDFLSWGDSEPMETPSGVKEAREKEDARQPSIRIRVWKKEDARAQEPIFNKLFNIRDETATHRKWRDSL